MTAKDEFRRGDWVKVQAKNGAKYEGPVGHVCGDGDFDPDFGGTSYVPANDCVSIVKIDPPKPPLRDGIWQGGYDGRIYILRGNDVLTGDGSLFMRRAVLREDWNSIATFIGPEAIPGPCTPALTEETKAK